MRANTCVGAVHEVGDRSLITADSQPRFSLRYDVPFDSFAFLRVVQSLWLSTRADIDASAFLALLANSACRAHFKRTFCIKGAEEKRLQSHIDTEKVDKDENEKRIEKLSIDLLSILSVVEWKNCIYLITHLPACINHLRIFSASPRVSSITTCPINNNNENRKNSTDS